jgi:hypothetical protein
MSMAEQEIEELAGQIGLSVAELSHILTRDQWHVDYSTRHKNCITCDNFTTFL